MIDQAAPVGAASFAAAAAASDQIVTRVPSSTTALLGNRK